VQVSDVLARSLNATLPAPALALTGGGLAIAEPSGSVRDISSDEARAFLNDGNAIICHTSWFVRRMGAQPKMPVYDILELQAFVHPARACLPSPAGIAAALNLPGPENACDAASVIATATERLLHALSQLPAAERDKARNLAMFMLRCGWRWAPAVLAVLGQPERQVSPMAALEVWRSLPEWEDAPPPSPQGQEPVAGAEAQARLIALIGSRGAMRRPQQDFTAAAADAFVPRAQAGSPNIVLAEAGTGTGKTLGYLAPVSLWVEKNGPSVWVSTYTRNLQRQIVQEAQKLARRTGGRKLKTVLRKGRENYLCLLNFEDAVKHSAVGGGSRAIVLGLLSRWVAATSDGDVTGETFPGFLPPELRRHELTDRRGECIYSACAHYRRCFVEHSIRGARSADIVVANHALVMAHASHTAVRSEADEATGPLRYVFDEGHHLFDAADAAFAALLSGAEMAELRHWIRGPEGRRSRSRGLEDRLGDLISGDEATNDLRQALMAAGMLAGEGWLSRVKQGMGRGAGEEFLARIYQHVLARSPSDNSPYAIEAEVRTMNPDMRDAARELDHALVRLAVPLQRLAGQLRAKLDDDAAKLDTAQKAQTEAVARGLERRTQLIIPAWRDMLGALEEGESEQTEFALWYEIQRENGRDLDVGLHRRWIDPTIPFAETVLKNAHGVLITSATLRDTAEVVAETSWRSAEVRVGAHHLAQPPRRAVFDSPFNWPEQARVFVVRDIPRRDHAQLAAAYRELFLCAGGGALGLFTAIGTLKDVYARIAEAVSDAGLMLYAQHIDALDAATLVDLFRADENACLLGTDALRDGIDVPGRSLRLCVFDKVPWPKPSILHRARRERFGRGYDELIARLRLKQAFGRLIRSETDRGVFVILDGACPSRLLAGFPPQIPAIRCGLKHAVEQTRRFLDRESV
jgi:ATP-dependent DNA helicase DinG